MIGNPRRTRLVEYAYWIYLRADGSRVARTKFRRYRGWHRHRVHVRYRIAVRVRKPAPRKIPPKVPLRRVPKKVIRRPARPAPPPVKRTPSLVPGQRLLEALLLAGTALTKDTSTLPAIEERMAGFSARVKAFTASAVFRTRAGRELAKKIKAAGERLNRAMRKARPDRKSLHRAATRLHDLLINELNRFREDPKRQTPHVRKSLPVWQAELQRLEDAPGSEDSLVQELLNECEGLLGQLEGGGRLWTDTDPWMEKEMTRLEVDPKAWEIERRYLHQRTRGFLVDQIYLGDSEKRRQPVRFLWDRALTPSQLLDYRARQFYFWCVVELPAAWSQYVVKGRLVYTEQAAPEKGKTTGPEARRALEGCVFTLTPGAEFSGNLTASEFYDWVHGESVYKKPRTTREEVNGELKTVQHGTPSVVEGEAIWQSTMRRHLVEQYDYLQRKQNLQGKVKVVAFVAFTGLFAPTRTHGVNPPTKEE